MLEPLLFRLMQRIFAKQLVCAAYTGLLGRPPDPAGLSSYAVEMTRREGLAAVLADISKSDEAREHSRVQTRRHTEALAEQLGKQVNGRPHRDRFDLGNRELIKAAYGGLLGREPDDEGMDTYTRYLESTNDFSRLLEDIANSREHRGRIASSAMTVG